MALLIGGKSVRKAKTTPVPLTPTEKLLVNALVSVNQNFVDSLDVAELSEAIQNLNPDDFAQLIDSVLVYKDVDDLIKSSLRQTVLLGGTAETRSIIANSPNVAQTPLTRIEFGDKILPGGIRIPGNMPEVPGLSFSIETPVDRMFNSINGWALQYAETRSSQLIVAIDSSNKLAIQQLITQSFTEPRSVDKTARMIKKIIGLHPRWALAVERFHDKNFRKGIEDGMSTVKAEARADAMAVKYRNKLIRRRAMTIARTEIQQAQNFGRESSWVAADEMGLIDPRSMKQWKTAPVASSYGSPCDICMDLRGTIVPWNGDFDNGSSMPPAHPNCRCTAVILPPSRGLTGLPSQNVDSWISRLDALEAEQLKEMKKNVASVSRPSIPSSLVSFDKHLASKHDQKTHGRWSFSGKEVQVSDASEAWQELLSAESRELSDPEGTYPEKYNPRGTADWGLKDGETTLRLVRDQETPRVRRYETNDSAGLTSEESKGVDGTVMFAYGPGKNLVPTGTERPPKHVYRVMSVDEFDSAQSRGYIKSDERMNVAEGEGTVASLSSTGNFYAPVDGSDYRVVRINYSDEDSWKIDPDDSYLKTDSRIPFDRVDLFSSPVGSVMKHLGSKHDQKTHGTWAAGSAGSYSESLEISRQAGTTNEFLEWKEGEEIKVDSAAALAISEFKGKDGPLYGAAIEKRQMANEHNMEKLTGLQLQDGGYQIETMRENLENIKDQGTVMIAADAGDAISILEDGRFKSQFETTDSKGAYAPDVRAMEETSQLGLHPSTIPESRPIYGYVSIENPVNQSVAHYGNVRFELKDSVKERTTITDGDSLGSPSKPIPMTGPLVTEMQAASVGGHGGKLQEFPYTDIYEYVDNSFENAGMFDNGPYIEAQVKSGVKVSDVQKIYISENNTKYAFDKLIELAEKEGIEYESYYADGE